MTFNNLFIAFVSSVGVSSFPTANTLLGFFWVIPAFMLIISWMMFSIWVGEQEWHYITKVLKEIVNALFVLIYACYKTKTRNIGN